MKMPDALKAPAARLLAALLAFAAAVAAYLAMRADPPASPPVPVQGVEEHYGWVPDPVAVGAVRQSLAGSGEFAATEAFRARYTGPDDVFLWEACRQVTGAVLPARDQGRVGACVGFGTAAAVEHLMCVEVAANKSSGGRTEYRDLAQEVIYAGSRVEIGGGKVSGDGSVGAWAAEFVRAYGVVPRGVYAGQDLTRYSEARCRDFGRTGVPAELEAVARQHPVKGIANVRRWPEAQAAIRHGYPVAVCSRQGFRMARDADGFCAPDGVWYHCMALVGVRGGARPGGFLLNSWGPAAHTGPRGPGDPPAAGFWADAAVLDRMLADGDSWAFSGFAGFPARRLDWYAAVRPAGVVTTAPAGP